MRAHMVIGRQEGSSVPQRIVAIAIGVVLSLGLLAGTADASVRATPSIQGSGTVADTASSFSCTKANASNSSVTACSNPDLGHLVSKGPCTIIIRTCLQFMAADLTASPAAGWKFVGWQNAGTCATDAFCRLTGSAIADDDSVYTPTAVFRQIVETSFSQTPPAFTNSRDATLVFASPVGKSYSCKIDDAAPGSCGTVAADHSVTLALSGLKDALHTVEVTATSMSDNVSDTAAAYSWTVDTAAPAASLDPASGPGQGALQTIDSETFKLVSSEDGGTFLCSLDGAAFAACDATTVLTGLAAGAHAFR